ncbi:Hypothetical predicted protein [Paramuricea clavata]|uniref:Uncharacterized protein n=1 Tax=Paramuricea clavata TaxID=317549 RepID=A0A7D9DKH1_PARCT|nr:Hypothetical predicted protein [Paramuricea clavata]
MVRASRAAAGVKQIVQAMEKASNIKKISNKHSYKKSNEDESPMFQDLRKLKPFAITSGRHRNHFHDIALSPTSNIKISNFFKWLQKHKRQISMGFKNLRPAQREPWVRGWENAGTESKEFDKDIDHINLLLYTKDRFGISNQPYHEVPMICKDMPGSYMIKDRLKKINEKWNLFPTPGNTVSSTKYQIEIGNKIESDN